MERRPAVIGADLGVILTELSQRAQKRITLNGLLQKWQNFVREVERGYEDSIYEYTNDLSIRDLLEEVIRRAPDAAREHIRSLVAPWDERFMKATKGGEKSLRPRTTKPCEAWWFRIPISARGEFKNDLQAEGFLS